jgi:hypothetical protein
LLLFYCGPFRLRRIVQEWPQLLEITQGIRIPMRTLHTLAVGCAVVCGTVPGCSFGIPVPAAAAVGISVPPPGFYGAYRIQAGPCSSPRFAFDHPGRCGYPRYNEPVFVDGVWVNEPLYYRLFRGHRYFWHRGRWVIGHGRWDGYVFPGGWQRLWRERGWDRLGEERRERHPEESRDRHDEYDHDERSDDNDNLGGKDRGDSHAPPHSH